jgi:hypothetical protein
VYIPPTLFALINILRTLYLMNADFIRLFFPNFPEDFNDIFQLFGKKPLPTTGSWRFMEQSEEAIYKDNVLMHSMIFIHYNYIPHDLFPITEQPVLVQFILIDDEKNISTLISIDYIIYPFRYNFALLFTRN